MRLLLCDHLFVRSNWSERTAPACRNWVANWEDETSPIPTEIAPRHQNLNPYDFVGSTDLRAIFGSLGDPSRLTHCLALRCLSPGDTAKDERVGVRIPVPDVDLAENASGALACGEEPGDGSASFVQDMRFGVDTQARRRDGEVGEP